MKPRNSSFLFSCLSFTALKLFAGYLTPNLFHANNSISNNSISHDYTV